MTRACGIRIGPRRFELFVLDGSTKKPRIVTAVAGDYPAGEDGAEAAAQAIGAALREHKVSTDNVGVAVECRAAAFRRLQLPFGEQSKIEPVLKFEVESQLPQFSIDDVVVDYHVLESTPNQSSLLVTAFPKEELRRTLKLCEAAGFEPVEVELESTAIVNAAISAGLCGTDAAHLIVHVGEESTAVAVVDGGNLREMRAIQFGWLTSRAPAAEAAEEDSEAVAALHAGDEQHRQREIVGRIRRELARTITGSRLAHELSAILLCGFRIPDLEGSDVLGVPVRAMEDFVIEGGAGAHGYASAAVAYGAALRQLGGGVLHPRLRREELRFSGTLERLELPLAVVSLLLVTLLGVFCIFVSKEREVVDIALKSWRDSSNNYMYPDPREGQSAKLRYPSDKLKSYVELLRNQQDDPDRNRLEQLAWIRQMLRNEVAALEKDLGRDGEILQPQSALEGLTLVLSVLERNQAEVRRPSIRAVRSTYQQGRSGKPERVRVTLDITFFGESTVEGTRDFERFNALVREQPWFVDFEDKRSEPLEGGKGIFKQGIVIEADVSKARKEVSS